MPQRNRYKTYIENGYYHVYNRGVEKRKIFLEEEDYEVFLHLLKYYLSPSDSETKHPLKEFSSVLLVRPRPLANVGQDVELLAYCLMPNHFHLLVKQQTLDGMTKLLRRLLTTYSMYFNKKNDRVGHLFQGTYKAALITEDPYILHLSRYIHLNPLELPLTGSDPVNYPYSSYTYYLGLKKSDWIKPDFILKFFESNRPPSLKGYNSYKKFVEENKEDSASLLGSSVLDEH